MYVITITSNSVTTGWQIIAYQTSTVYETMKGAILVPVAFVK